METQINYNLIIRPRKKRKSIHLIKNQTVKLLRRIIKRDNRKEKLNLQRKILKMMKI